MSPGLTHSLLTFDLNELVCHRNAIINVTREFIEHIGDIHLPANKLAILTLLAVVHNPETSLDDIEAKISQDVAMMEIALLRARLCELLASRAGLPTGSYFTVGMFSALDILMKQPIQKIAVTTRASQ